MPVDVVLEPRESVNNQGLLHVELLRGEDIHALDRGGGCIDLLSCAQADKISSGKSDPFAVFSLNGRRVYKSQTKKKTLKPVWDEKFDVQVVSKFLLHD